MNEEVKQWYKKQEKQAQMRAPQKWGVKYVRSNYGKTCRQCEYIYIYI